MQAYHEREAATLLEGRVVFKKAIVKEPRTMVNPHWHEAYEILYVRHGSGKQQINSNIFDFAPGTVVVICPGDIHATVAASQNGSEIDVLQFRAEYFGSREELLTELASSVAETATREIGELLERIAQHANGTNTGDSLIVSGEVFMLCGILLKNRKSAASVGKMTEFISNACQYLRDHDDIRLEAVAQHFGYSHEHFSRKFHAELGISYKHYCEKIKMQKFIRACEGNDVSLSEIAAALGYSDTSSFVRAFKRIYGIAPGAYRRLKNNRVLKRDFFSQ